ncbi:MAG: transpeptidase family protein [Bacteroidetes bacterium]|jgi:cell division protein FtsI (penicillin-binding protein 3)|nr:transpeptidase family protein [Bacteroidota bacterium]MBT6684741.1 transpeptidase family protein [Bacteroidota bacterium]MBT7143842.1 transpeptidase family protein [Bacteroidota bacterium]MBT7489977.1 transpeptidase family protein [Bacteroidota bacterium]
MIENDRKIKAKMLGKFKFVFLLVSIFFVLAIFRILHLQIVEGDKWKEYSKYSQRYEPIEAKRGNIYSDDGKLLVSTVSVYEVRMDLITPAITDKIFNRNVDSLSICLAKFHNKTKDYYKNRIIKARRKKNRGFSIAKDISYNQLLEIKKFPILRRGRFYGGMLITESNSRARLFKGLADRTLGNLRVVDSDDSQKQKKVGYAGLEGAFDGFLKGKEGIQLEEKIAGNLWISVNKGNTIEPQSGSDIVSTLNIEIQDIAHNSLMKNLKKYDADYGVAIVMEVETGEIKAIVNLDKTSTGYRETKNRAIGTLVEPGSTFKLASYMALLDENLIDTNDIVDIEDGTFYYMGKKFKDSDDETTGKITIKRGFEISSNVAIVKTIIAKFKNNPQAFVSKLKEFNLGEKLEIPLIGEAQPILRNPDDTLWSGISLPQMSYGYEIMLTPLQILHLYNAIANDGVPVKPMFIKHLRSDEKITKTFKSQRKPTICSKKTLRKMQKMLEGVVENGTATNLKDKYCKIAGKTGTTQLTYNNRSKKMEYQSTFAGYFPSNDPKYSCIVIINNPKGWNYYGATVAGPVFKDIALSTYSKMNELHEDISEIAENQDIISILPTSKSGKKLEIENVLEELKIPMNAKLTKSAWVSTKKEEKEISLKSRKISEYKNIVPNVRDMGLQDALYLLENCGLRVIFSGTGRVKNQSILQGTKIRKGTSIKIVLG